jgi:hypothetical protein
MGGHGQPRVALTAAVLWMLVALATARGLAGGRHGGGRALLQQLPVVATSTPVQFNPDA